MPCYIDKKTLQALSIIVDSFSFYHQEFHVIGEEVREDRLTIWIDPLDATDEYIAGKF